VSCRPKQGKPASLRAAPAATEESGFVAPVLGSSPKDTSAPVYVSPTLTIYRAYAFCHA